MQGVGKQRMKDINRKSVMRLLMQAESVSQTAMMSATGLKKATISVLTNELREMGLVSEAGEGSLSCKGGRRQQYLRLEQKKITAFGASLRPGGIRCGLCSLDGCLLSSEIIPLQGYAIEDWAPLITQRVRAAARKSRQSHLFYTGAGFITGSTYNPEKKEFIGFSQCDAPHQRLSTLFNDTMTAGDDYPNGMALGEMWFGVAKGLRNFLYLQLRNPKVTLVIDGKIYRGARHVAGEVSATHTGTERLGPRINAGPAIFNDEAFLDWVADLNRYYDPEKIVLSAENLLPGLLENLALLNRRAGGNIVLGALGESDSPRASAALVFEAYFDSNVIQ
ncbi:MAG: hypothetical protein V1913_17485 [Fibrobacterota bacterium]